MKTFLTLLAAITSLSAYTLVGVHACPVCPHVNDQSAKAKCVSSDLKTSCTYNHGIHASQDLTCIYGLRGSLIAGSSSPSCPKTTLTTSTYCPLC
ncbi:hypothetical protein PAXRUDRAFT_756784 [Paxillus rubicundulus Ve08.2h10]|uniref:Secreted protein n=1 Tax=Paxillus rubicundulus Ve08.2h10 TaxID=930991 RepID=A0A0D0D0I9_9AGAM|nr:hypothetical protein PAXRUDRAFT_756784 [Paxillus rubicundulus Ve08.2h10]